MADNTNPEHDDTEPETPDPETGTDDSDTSTDTNDAPADDQQDTDGGDGEDWQAKAELYKAQMRKNEQRAKANHAENQKLREELETLRQATKASEDTSPPTDKGSEDPVAARMEQLATELAEIKKTSQQLAEENARVKHQQMVAEVAATKGLTAAQAKRLTGDTREELEADADEVIALFGLKSTKPAPPKPKERKPLRDGASNGSGGDRSREEILAAVTSTGRRRRT